MTNAQLRAHVKTRDDEVSSGLSLSSSLCSPYQLIQAMRNNEERAEAKKTIEGLKQVVKGLREAWAQERKRAARSDPIEPPADYGSGSFYPTQSAYNRYDNRQYSQPQPNLYQQSSMSHLPPPVPPQYGQQSRNVWGPQPSSYGSTSGLETAFRSASIGSFSSNEDYSPRSFGSSG
jgi:hypothetical protein